MSENPSSATPRRFSIYPRALRYNKIRLGLTNKWWALVALLGFVMLGLGLTWRWALPVVLLVYILGFVCTRIDPLLIEIYMDYAKQHDRYETGYNPNQKHNLRPEGYGRDYPG